MRALRCWAEAEVLSLDSAPRAKELGPLDAKRRQEAAEAAALVRCPCCRAPLVARMGRYGPCFPCRCGSAKRGA